MLEGKVAIITGGGQGVGRGIALALAKEGARIAVTGRTPAKCAAVVEEIEKAGSKGIALGCNVKEPGELQHIVDETLKAFGGIDILVNNAQEVPLGPLLSVTDEDFGAGWESGPLATFRLMKLCHPHMKARGGGNIVNLASSSAMRWDMRNYGAYGAVKEAIRVLTRAAAAEWGPDNIRVNTIAPHAKSPALDGWINANPKEAEEFFKTIPLGRVGELEEDIGAAVVMLVSPYARYLTGATLPLDGGQSRFV
jgi:NAD(P)-dependent dehydrogenase (short-subunit alcohol dehydrogenase family)